MRRLSTATFSCTGTTCCWPQSRCRTVSLLFARDRPWSLTSPWTTGAARWRSRSRPAPCLGRATGSAAASTATSAPSRAPGASSIRTDSRVTSSSTPTVFCRSSRAWSSRWAPWSSSTSSVTTTGRAARTASWRARSPSCTSRTPCSSRLRRPTECCRSTITRRHCLQTRWPCMAACRLEVSCPATTARACRRPCPRTRWRCMAACRPGGTCPASTARA
mmetsp:Transcript_99006/g.317527  ORF Transcript_99006/g.317527 Transcript_99006/m.317527 type:complete len:219 (-) Transcript_99006:1138-1794(-)